MVIKPLLAVALALLMNNASVLALLPPPPPPLIPPPPLPLLPLSYQPQRHNMATMGLLDDVVGGLSSIFSDGTRARGAAAPASSAPITVETPLSSLEAGSPSSTVTEATTPTTTNGNTSNANLNNAAAVLTSMLSGLATMGDAANNNDANASSAGAAVLSTEAVDINRPDPEVVRIHDASSLEKQKTDNETMLQLLDTLDGMVNPNTVASTGTMSRTTTPLQYIPQQLFFHQQHPHAMNTMQFGLPFLGGIGGIGGIGGPYGFGGPGGGFGFIGGIVDTIVPVFNGLGQVGQVGQVAPAQAIVAI